MLTLQLDEARQLLTAVEEAMACGNAIRPEVLSRFWLVEGAAQSIGGDAEAAHDAFAAASLADSEVWLDALGPKMREVYEAAGGDVVPVGVLEWTPTDAWAAVDGVAVQSPATVPGGLRLVQIGSSETDIQFARIIEVSVAGYQTLHSGVIIERQPEVAPVAVAAVAEIPEVQKEEPGSPVGLYISVGGGVAFGAPFDFADRSGTFEEPALKLVLPGQAGLSLRLDRAWVRAVVHGAPLLTGTYLFASADGIAASSLSYGGSLAGGPRLGAVDLGLSAGVQIPSRIIGRGIVAVGLGDLPLSAELSGGVNYVAGRGLEPAASIGIGFATNQRGTP